LVQSGLEIVDDFSFSTDDHTWAFSVDCDFSTAGRAPDVKATKPRFGGVLHQELANEQTLDVAVNDGS
jgi:hypothetical protein